MAFPEQETPSGHEKSVTFGTIVYWANNANPEPLPQYRKRLTTELFTEKEWLTLISLHNFVNGNLYGASSPGQAIKRIALPVEFAEGAGCFQTAAARCTVVKKASDLIVKSQGSVSSR